MRENLFGDTINPSTIYYLMIFAFIIAVRFFTTYKSNRPIKEIMFVSLEIVYSCVGLAILLLSESTKADLSAVFAIYVVLLVIAAFLEASREDFREKTAYLIAHCTLIGLVVIATIYLNQTTLYQRAPKSDAHEQMAKKEYRVSVPYYDLSLRYYLGNKLGTRKLVYIAHVKDTSIKSAIEQAKLQFWDKDTVQTNPFDPKRVKSPSELMVDSDEIIAEELRH